MCFARSPSYLESSSFQQADLVVLGEVAEARDPLGEVDHFPHGGGEAHGELLPDLLARFTGVHVRRCVHGTDLRRHEDRWSVRGDQESVLVLGKSTLNK